MNKINKIVNCTRINSLLSTSCCSVVVKVFALNSEGCGFKSKLGFFLNFFLHVFFLNHRYILIIII